LISACRIYLKIVGSILCIPLIISLIPVHVWAAETIPVKILINTLDKGTHLLMMTPDGDLLLSSKQLEELGFKDVPPNAIIYKNGLVSLKSLSPKVTFTIDNQESTLRVTADPTLLEKTVIDLGYKRPENVIYTTNNSAFLNYAIDYTMGDRFDFKSVSVPMEAGLKIGEVLAYSSVSYTKTDAEDRFLRLASDIITDDPVHIRRYTAGDLFASSGVLGGRVMLGGLSVTKNFSIDPYFIRYQGLELSGVLKTPSEVDLYVNNIPVKKNLLPPGEFDFSNLYGFTGAGDAVLVIKDAFGNEQTMVTSFYLSSMLLKPGLHDYSYNIGFKRTGFGTENSGYSGVTVLGFHRYGFTKTFTAGLSGEADQNIINIGSQAALLLGKAGELDSALAISRENGENGQAAFVNYSYYNGFLSGNASFGNYSKDYTNLLIEDSTIHPRYEGRISLGLHVRALGSISVNAQFLSRYNQADITRGSIFYSRPLGSHANLSVTASRTDDTKTSYQVFAGVFFILGKDHFGTVNYQSEDSLKSVSASFEKIPPTGTGIAYKIQAESQNSEDWGPGGLSYLQYNGPYGDYSVAVRRASGVDTYDLDVSGGIALIGNSFYLSRPITDSFALVNVGGIDGVRIYQSNVEVAVTNEKGQALLPSLVSYNDNKLSFEASDVPINYEITEAEKYLSPRYRSGSIVSFNLKKIQAFEGNLYFVTKGVRRPAESAVLEVRMGEKTVRAVVGMKGQFYIENLKPGKYPATLTLEGKECHFEMAVPESNEMFVNMGEISCEIY
jgi:outer membrane usher protein